MGKIREMDILSFWRVLIPIVGVTCIIVIGGLIWSVSKIKEFLGGEYVTKIECNECSNLVKRDLHNEILEVQEKATKMDEVLIRIDTKVDLLLSGKIKGGELKQ